MGIALPDGTNVTPVRVHGKCAWVEWTVDEQPSQLHIVLAYTCDDEQFRNAKITLNPGNCGEEWPGLIEFANDDKTADEIVVYMNENNLGQILVDAWNPDLMVVTG